MCVAENIIITENMAESLTPVKSDVGECGGVSVCVCLCVCVSVCESIGGSRYVCG